MSLYPTVLDHVPSHNDSSEFRKIELCALAGSQRGDELAEKSCSFISFIASGKRVFPRGHLIYTRKSLPTLFCLLFFFFISARLFFAVKKKTLF
jgi:hypothetical protein